jgi:hypothetical protein
MGVNDGAENDGDNRNHQSPSVKPPRAPPKRLCRSAVGTTHMDV